MRGNVCLLFCVLYGSVPRHKIFFLLFWNLQIVSKFVEKVTVQKILETQPYKTPTKCKQKTEPLIEYCLYFMHLKISPKFFQKDFSHNTFNLSIWSGFGLLSIPLRIAVSDLINSWRLKLRERFMIFYCKIKVNIT